jgi:hypothetical protein
VEQNDVSEMIAGKLLSLLNESGSAGGAIARNIKIPVAAAAGGVIVGVGASLIIDIQTHPNADASHRIDVAILSATGGLLALGATTAAITLGAPILAAVAVGAAVALAVDFAFTEFPDSNGFSPTRWLNLDSAINTAYSNAALQIGSTTSHVETYLTDAIANASNYVIDSISDMQSVFDAARTLVSPLILDLDGNGVQTTSLIDGTYFDHNNNGLAEQTAWVGSNDGLLVFDRNQDGVINGGNEVFGNNTLLSTNVNATNGFAALADLDTNSDGKIDSSDTNFSNLQVLKGDGANVNVKIQSHDGAKIQRFGIGVLAPHGIKK